MASVCPIASKAPPNLNTRLNFFGLLSGKIIYRAKIDILMVSETCKACKRQPECVMKFLGVLLFLVCHECARSTACAREWLCDNVIHKQQSLA